MSRNVKCNDTKSILQHIHSSANKYNLSITGDKNENVLTKVSELMMQLATKKDFNQKYMKLNMISKGANGKIFGVKSWDKSEFFAMKQIDFEYLNIETIYKILT